MKTIPRATKHSHIRYNDGQFGKAQSLDAEDLREKTIVLLSYCLLIREVERMPTQTMIHSNKVEDGGQESLELRSM
jgi:hypothetical protein